MQALDATHFSRFERRVAWNAEHSPFRKFLGKICRFPGHYGEPFLHSGKKFGELQQQQRLPPGIHSRYMFGRAQLHAKDDSHLTPARRRYGKRREACRPRVEPGDGTGSEGKPVGPALSGSANHVAISGGTAATLFKRSVAVDDRVFLVIANQQP